MKFIQNPPARTDRAAVFIARNSRSSAGFTLIEVVLALTIFALMGTILYGAFSLGHSAVERTQSGFHRSQKLRSASDLLASYVRSAHPYRRSEQDQSVYFSGEIDSLTFVSAYSHGMGGRGMAKITIARGEAGDGRAMLKLEESVPARLSDEGGGAGQTHQLTIQENIRDFRLAYLDPQAETEQWEDRWDGGERRVLPRAVRFAFIDEDGKEVRWVFPLMMTVLAQ